MEERRRTDRRAFAATVAPPVRAVATQLYDSDTGLVSTTLFRDRTEHALRRAARCDGRVALVLLEIGIPETEVDAKRERRRVGAEMLKQIRPEDTAAWLDERFVGVLVEDVAASSGPQRMRRRLHGSLARCNASSVAVSDSHGRIGYWLGGAETE
jgi:hypothetical protein